MKKVFPEAEVGGVNFLLSFFLFFDQEPGVSGSSGGNHAHLNLDQVEDAHERQAFEALYREGDLVVRRTKVSAFLRRFPTSWLLAQVYEAGARASFELNDHATGIYYARESLKLLPENPLLTGTMAAVLANRGDRPSARALASETVRYLDRFRPPAGDNARLWRTAEERLRETAHRILGQAPAKETTRPKNRTDEFAGSAACQRCHNEQWKAWRSTGMANMLHPIEQARVIGDFTRLEQYRDGGALSAKGGHTNGKFYIDLLRRNGKPDRFSIDYTIGSKWQQAYATRTASGDLHVLPIQFNRLTSTWINYWRMIDPPNSGRSEPGDFHRLREVTSYQKNCAACHTSQSNEKGFLEPGVNCEMCHGPGAAHAKGAPANWSFAKVNHRDYVEVCAQCHAQSAIREPQGFPPRYQRRPYSEFSRKAFYRDGRFRETTFIVEAFERSACFQKGEAHCGHCHNPHPQDAARNRTSLKLAKDSDQMCLQCHQASYQEAGHTRHAAGEASQCVNCHMPKIMNSLLFLARTHEIDDRPQAAPVQRFGRQESPNACLGCHADRDDAWLARSLRDWSPPVGATLRKP